MLQTLIAVGAVIGLFNLVDPDNESNMDWFGIAALVIVPALVVFAIAYAGSAGDLNMPWLPWLSVALIFLFPLVAFRAVSRLSWRKSLLMSLIVLITVIASELVVGSITRTVQDSLIATPDENY